MTALRVQPDDSEYLRQLQAEADFFDKPHFLSADQEMPPTGYWNERFTGDPRISWFESIPQYGTFRRGWSFGAALYLQRGLMEQNPQLHLTVYDISEESLAAIERDAAARFPGRVALERTDLNFAELPAGTFDMIVSDSCLHHLINLEYVAQQINHALTPEGYFFLRDYTGETRFHFTDAKRRAFEAALRHAGSRQQALQNWTVDWPDLDHAGPDEFSPFEAVRSEDTLGILRAALREEFVRPAGALLGLVLFAHPPQVYAGVPDEDASFYRRARFAVGRMRNRFFSQRQPGYRDLATPLALEIAPIDRVISEAGLLLPMLSFSMYRKKP